MARLGQNEQTLMNWTQSGAAGRRLQGGWCPSHLTGQKGKSSFLVPVVLSCCTNINNVQLPINKLSPSSSTAQSGRAGPLSTPHVSTRRRLLAPGWQEQQRWASKQIPKANQYSLPVETAEAVGSAVNPVESGVILYLHRRFWLLLLIF